MNIILFLLIITVLVFVHELGHFLTAKIFGIRVEEFALGFPPKILHYKYGETTYTLNLIPFGGFVKIFGEDPNDELSGTKDYKKSFIAKSKYIQTAVLFAGIFFNFVFAWVMFTASMVVGTPAPINAANGLSFKDGNLAIVDISKNSPAEKAGFKIGDRILYLESGLDHLQNIDTSSVPNFINSHANQNIITLIRRGTDNLKINSMPTSGIVENRAVLGIALSEVGLLKLSLTQAVTEGLKTTVSSTILTTKGLFEFIYRSFSGKANLSEVTGPLGLVPIVGTVSAFGLGSILNFVAIISVNLAVINLIPFPALDGGRILFVIIESITRRPINTKLFNTLNTAGFILLVILMILVTYRDFVKIW